MFCVDVLKDTYIDGNISLRTLSPSLGTVQGQVGRLRHQSLAIRRQDSAVWRYRMTKGQVTTHWGLPLLAEAPFVISLIGRRRRV